MWSLRRVLTVKFQADFWVHGRLVPQPSSCSRVNYMLTDSRDCHHNRFYNISSTLQRNLMALDSPIPPLRPSPWWPLISFPLLRICLFGTFIHKWNHTVCGLCVWLRSLNRRLARITHGAAWIHAPSSVYWRGVSTVWICRLCLLICPSVHGRLCCAPSYHITASVLFAMWHCQHLALWHSEFPLFSTGTNKHPFFMKM